MDLQHLGSRLLVVFDGQCGFCNGSVRWLARRDRRDRLRFVASADARAVELLERHGMGAARFVAVPSTLLVLRFTQGEVTRVHVRSEAVLAALDELHTPWPALSLLLRAVPLALRDAGYRIVARMRYRLGGRAEACPLPSAAEQAKFL